MEKKPKPIATVAQLISETPPSRAKVCLCSLDEKVIKEGYRGDMLDT